MVPDTPFCISDNATSLHFTEPRSIALMDSNEHFWILKQELAERKHRLEVMGKALDAILSKLNINLNEQRVEENSGFRRNQEELLRSPSRESTNLTPFSETSQKCSKVKLAAPAGFDGSHKKGHAFLNSCMIYFTICNDHFLNDQAHIHWALSFFKTECVACFADKVLCSWRKGKAYYLNWDAFEEDFVEHFCPKDEQLSAITKLKGTTWYQGKDSVEDYIYRFQELIL